MQFVEKLKPVEFVYNNKDGNKKSLGFIAQEVQEVMKGANMDTNAYGLVPVVNESESTLGLTYVELIPVLTKAIQEQQVIIETLVKRIETLETK